jgi:two-component SAPR family response regulator
LKTPIHGFYKLLLAALFLLSAALTGYSQENNLTGIKFNSQNVPLQQKTSVFLNEGNPIELNNSFSISFDISFWDFRKFGPILRIDDEQGNEIRVIYIQFKNKDTSCIQIIEPFNKTSLDINIPKNKLTRNRWFNVKLAIDKNEKSLKAFWNNDLAGELSYPAEKQNQFKFVFGIKEIKNLNDNDVPAIAVKNVIITENDKIKYQWELNPFKENPLTDKYENAEIKTINPIWLYQDHQKWKHVKDFLISNSSISCLGVAFDSVNSRLFIDRKKDLLIYDLISCKDSIIKYDSQSPAYWNELFYDNEKQVLYSFMNGMGKVSIFDLRKTKWIVSDTSINTSGHYFGSAKFSYPNADDIYLLGGYGWYSVKNDLFKYDFNQREWKKVELKKNEMSPRAWFTFGKSYSEGEFLIYGGTGNESGKQEDGFNNYNDFFLLNLNDSTIKKIEYPERQNINNSTYANYLYLDKKDSTIYFLSKTKEGDYFNIYLNKLNLNTGTVSKVGDTFWSSESDKWIYHYLHFNKTTNEFISVIFDSTLVELYSINYPPISESAQVYAEDKDSGKNNLLLILIPIIVLIIGAAVFIYQRKRNSNTGVSKSDKKEDEYNFVTRHIKNSVNLFGGLWIYDNNENEISQSLPPKLKEIFLLILIRSLNNHHSGITSEELSSIIWPDSSPESVKSNRGVAINKLRKALSSVDGLELEFSDKLWSVKFSNGAGCDYLEYLKLKISKQSDSDSENHCFQTISNIFSGGEFLKGVSYAWLDSIKFAINNEVIIFLKQYFDDMEVQQDVDKHIKLCDIILLFDPVDQDAIKSKIKTLSSVGKHHIAKNTYNLFAAEYKRLYDEHFPLSLEELINS